MRKIIFFITLILVTSISANANTCEQLREQSRVNNWVIRESGMIKFEVRVTPTSCRQEGLHQAQPEARLALHNQADK